MASPATTPRARQFSLRSLCALMLAAAALFHLSTRWNAEQTLASLDTSLSPAYCETTTDGQLAVLAAPAWVESAKPVLHSPTAHLRHVWLPTVIVVEPATGRTLLEIGDLDESVSHWRCETVEGHGRVFLLEESGGRQRQRAWRLPAGKELETGVAAALHAQFAVEPPQVRTPVWRVTDDGQRGRLLVVERIRRCPLGCDLRAFWCAVFCTLLAWRAGLNSSTG